MRKYLLLTLNGIQGFITAVQADGGFFVARSYIYRVFRNVKGADLLCPMAAGAVGKLYFQISFYVVWLRLVLDDGGFFVSDAHTKPIIEGFEGASLVCPMSAGKAEKLYFRTQ